MVLELSHNVLPPDKRLKTLVGTIDASLDGVKYIPGPTLATLTDMGDHWLFQSDSEAITEKVLEFFERKAPILFYDRDHRGNLANRDVLAWADEPKFLQLLRDSFAMYHNFSGNIVEKSDFQAKNSKRWTLRHTPEMKRAWKRKTLEDLQEMPKGWRSDEVNEMIEKFRRELKVA